MSIKLKTKLRLGMSFLLAVILIFGILSLFYINRLNNDSGSILKNNLESLVYSNNMLKALDEMPADKNAINSFEVNLRKQEMNITEPGESEVTQQLRNDFNSMRSNPSDMTKATGIRRSLQSINVLNQQAIVRKNEIAKKTAADAGILLTTLFVVLGLITLTFVVNFPSVISSPISLLNDGISEIANKNYSKRIFLKQHDEFGDLADAFNTMAEKLDEYESSNLAELRFEKSRIETIINQMKDGIIGLNAKRHVLFLNATAEKLLGLKEADITGKYVADIAVKNDLMRSLIKPDADKELKIFADNKESYFNKELLNVSSEGKMIGQVIILRNVTLFHELNEAKTNFIATVSHELKTPISSIKMSAQLLMDDRVGGLNDEQQGLVQSINDDGERLLKITSELLNLAQVETGHIQLNVHPVDPSFIIANAIDAVSGKARDKQILIQNKVAATLPFIAADADKTSWVLNNLLTNAIKFSPEKGLIKISAMVQEDQVLFQVQDNGVGIAGEFIPKLFERYFQVPGTTEKGTGLGLAISKDFIEAQQGKIHIESEVGKGTSVYFQLPIDKG